MCVTRSRTISFLTVGMRACCCSSSVEASMQPIIEGLHISGILNFLVCADTEDTTEEPSSDPHTLEEPAGENGGGEAILSGVIGDRSIGGAQTGLYSAPTSEAFSSVIYYILHNITLYCNNTTNNAAIIYYVQ